MKCPMCGSARVDIMKRGERKCKKDSFFPIGAWYVWVYHWACKVCGYEWRTAE